MNNLEYYLYEIKDYFYSVYGNNLIELTLFVIFLVLLFVITNVVKNNEIRKARADIGLLIGGWGTRGKSGTERLKAALMEACGHGYVSKSTGCEAMFIYAFPMGKSQELFLYRPYDKATIWEHFNLIVRTSKLKSPIFLWECMGLTPEYVYILQKEWSRDDYSTITNTYPDHEDLQGPAGINIPLVMGNFIPEKGNLVTTEESMYPILEESAKDLNTRITQVSGIPPALITQDILDRFPYEEHPNNIALVTTMARQMGIEEDFALKEMADRVIADLGVLKRYPITTIKNRRIEFTNGMSANERFGAMGNWTRMAYDTTTIEEEPDALIATVINNRADRVPRSRVFAAMVANDLGADYHFLIGTNLKGLAGYIDEEWTQRLEGLSLKDAENAEALQEIFENESRRMRVCLSEEALMKRVEMILGKLGVSNWESPSDDVNEWVVTLDKVVQPLDIGDKQKSKVKEFIIAQKVAHDTYARLYAECGNGYTADLGERIIRILSEWFHEKIKIIENPHTPGEAVIQFVVNELPPGTLTKLMGMQNIKGTGLDFIYRFQAWDRCYHFCQKLKQRQLETCQEGLTELSNFRDYGLLTDTEVTATIEEFKTKAIAQNDRTQADCSHILSKQQEAMPQTQSDSDSSDNSSEKNKTLKSFLDFIEGFFDIGDAVKRRKKVDAIYQDLIHERITLETSAAEIRQINKRQKGGWLSAKFS